MKKILLVRHAKTERGHDKIDFERLLTDRGVNNAHDMANITELKAGKPQYLLSSPAYRAKGTAEIFAKEMGIGQIATNQNIYEAGLTALYRVINNLPAEFDFAMLVGHNPGISELIYSLTGEFREVPTCAVALIEFEATDWAGISAETGKLAWYDSPKDH